MTTSWEFREEEGRAMYLEAQIREAVQREIAQIHRGEVIPGSGEPIRPRHFAKTETYKVSQWLSLDVDFEADAAYLHLTGNKVAETKQFGRINIDFDDAGYVVGIEILTLDPYVKNMGDGGC